VIRDLSTTIMRGDKVGIIGPNGSGKTTLLRLLLGELPPVRARSQQGTRLEVLYFDQMRDQLDPQKSVAENVGEGNDTLINGGKSRHIIGYLQDFLFTPDRARSAGFNPLRRRAQPAAAGQAVHQAGQRAGDGRADQRS
jgi:ABC transport system ATP-binding/permease protein